MNNTKKVRLLNSYVLSLECPTDKLNNITKLERTGRNQGLFSLKKNGTIPWNYTILRFNWHEGKL